jgi:hypothetical protein
MQLLRARGRQLRGGFGPSVTSENRRADDLGVAGRTLLIRDKGRAEETTEQNGSVRFWTRRAEGTRSPARGW